MNTIFPKSLVLLVPALLIFAIAPLQGLAADANAEHGEKLYKERCMGCHDTRVHTRPNRIIHTYEDLVNRVRFCDNQAKAGLKDNEIYDVAEFLNNEFYKFIKVKDNE